MCDEKPIFMKRKTTSCARFAFANGKAKLNLMELARFSGSFAVVRRRNAVLNHSAMGAVRRAGIGNETTGVRKLWNFSQSLQFLTLRLAGPDWKQY